MLFVIKLDRKLFSQDVGGRMEVVISLELPINLHDLSLSDICYNFHVFMRIFTAISLPKEIKDRATQIFQGRLPVPYINTTNLHITLNFFGELIDDEQKKVKEIFSQAVIEAKPFEIQFDKLVKFHQQIHMTLKPNPALGKLQSQLEVLFHDSGFLFQDRIYYPHVKLSNLHMDKVMFKDRKIEDFPNEELRQLSFMADRVVLYESKLLLHHAHHTQLIEITLK